MMALSEQAFRILEKSAFIGNCEPASAHHFVDLAGHLRTYVFTLTE